MRPLFLSVYNRTLDCNSQFINSISILLIMLALAAVQDLLLDQ